MIMNLKRLKILIWLFVVIAAGCADAGFGSSGDLSVQSGDLLFQDVNCGPLCDAIETVTTGYKGANLSHVGIAAKDEQGRMIVFEAVSKGVVATDLQTFLNRSVDANGWPKVIVGRLKGPFRHLIPAAIKEARSLKGKPYDKIFAIDNDAYCCSELIYEIFRRADGGKPVFELKPMTFKDLKTGQMLAIWKEYFAKLGVDIPEGRPGINPGGISRSPVLSIVYASESIFKKSHK